MKKRVLAVAVCTILFFAGCGSSEDQDNANDGKIIDILEGEKLPEEIQVNLGKAISDNPSQEEQKIFDTAHDRWYNMHTEEAIEKFESFLIDYPESCLADDAQYYIGVCYRDLMEYEKAINAFAKVVEFYPESSSLASAYYNIAYIYKYELDDMDKACLYYVACIENATVDDKDIVQHSAETLEENTSIKITYSQSDNIIDDGYLQSEISGYTKNTSELVDKIAAIAKNNASILTNEQINEIVSQIRQKEPDFYDDSETMEKYMYYGYLLDYAHVDSDPRSELGVDVYQSIKYVYRGIETIEDSDTQENLSQIKKDLQLIN